MFVFAYSKKVKFLLFKGVPHFTDKICLSLKKPKVISHVCFSLQELVEMVKAKKAAQAAVATNIQKSK